MNDSQFTRNDQIRAFLVVPPEVHLLDMTGPAHLFYEAKDYGAPIECHFISLREDQREAVSSAGLALHELQYFGDFKLNAGDMVLIPGLERRILLDPDFHRQNRGFYAWLRVQHLAGARVCSVCTGAFLLGYSGLFDGKKATTHWKYMDEFMHRFPRVNAIRNRLFVKDGNLYSSAGVSSGVDLALYLIEEDFGTAFASKIAREVVVYLRRGEADEQLSIFLQYRNHLDDRVHEVQDLLVRKLDQKQTIEDLALHVNMSPRNLTRLFKKTTSISIGQYLDKLRVERAIQLLGDGNKVQFVATSCGLNSTNQLRSLLKKYKGVLPSEVG